LLVRLSGRLAKNTDHRQILLRTKSRDFQFRIGLVRNCPWGMGSLSWAPQREFSNIAPPGEPPLLRWRQVAKDRFRNGAVAARSSLLLHGAF
jgi:hypothetical protein